MDSRIQYRGIDPVGLGLNSVKTDFQVCPGRLFSIYVESKDSLLDLSHTRFQPRPNLETCPVPVCPSKMLASSTRVQENSNNFCVGEASAIFHFRTEVHIESPQM